jgi:hypothetical protein
MIDQMNRSTRRHRLVAALACVVVLCMVGSLGHAAIIDGAHASRRAARGTQMRLDGGLPPRAVLISDSAISGIRWYGRQDHLTETHWDIYLESCRRLVAPSCRGREGYAPRTLVAELEHIRSGFGPAGSKDLLVIAVGYNDSPTTFRSDFATVMNTARSAGFRRIVWLTYRSNHSYHAPGETEVTASAAMNAILRDELQRGRWPGLGLWDYDAAMKDHDDWFASDGIHVTPDGASRVAEWLSAQLLRPLP